MGSESNSWRWSATGETSKATYEKWATGNPDFYTAHETCVAMTYDGVWVDVNCWSRSAFICYSGKRTWYIPPLRKKVSVAVFLRVK